MPSQSHLFDPPRPEGLRYTDDLITAEEEADLVARFAELPFKPFEFQGYLGKRRTVSFGWRYDHNDRSLSQAAAIPSFISPLRERAAAFAGFPADELGHVLVTEYAAGAEIGWHRDRPEFAEVVGVSFLTPAPLRFRRKRGTGWERITVPVAPRSAYLMAGPARTEWEHSIPALNALRYSMTFRRLKPA
jgi:alkylated DNA repair dioxygenase AlkB